MVDKPGLKVWGEVGLEIEQKEWSNSGAVRAKRNEVKWKLDIEATGADADQLNQEQNEKEKEHPIK